MNELERRETDVVVIGAGAAGLACARGLARYGLSCEVLEGAERIGGRIHTLRAAGWSIPIELGAEFVHGRPAPTLTLGGGAIALTRAPEHRVMVDDHVQVMPGTWQRFARALDDALQIEPDVSVATYLERARLSDDEQRLVRLIVEGFHAAPLADASARALAQDAAKTGYFEQFRTGDGYDRVLSELEHGIRAGSCDIHLGTRVTSVRWSRHRVRVMAHSRQGLLELSARRCVCTVSVGVLQDNGIEFFPRPPTFAALRGLGMGQALRCVLRCQDAPWVPAPDGNEPTFVHVPAAFGTLWRETRAGQQQITAWAGGPAAQALSRVDEATRLEAALHSLAVATNHTVAECRRVLIEGHCHDFGGDPLVRGAYSYVRPGGEEAARQLRQPCEETLFFAGEALAREYPASVAGALASGEDAARLVVSTSRQHREKSAPMSEI